MFVTVRLEPSLRGRKIRYQKTGTPLPKELREYVEEVSKTKAKVEPEQVGSSTEEDATKVDFPSVGRVTSDKQWTRFLIEYV